MRQPSRNDIQRLGEALHRTGRIDRRQLLAGLGALAALPPMMSSKAWAQAKEIVLVNWGGDAIEFMDTSFAIPYEEENPGIDVVVDGGGPSQGKIRAMVESGAVTWDICDSGGGSSIQLGTGGFIREIDYDVVDRKKFFPGMDFKWGATNYIYSFVLAYDTSEYDTDSAPKSWKDFFNTKDFPGLRSMRKDVIAVPEVALMGAGLAKEEVYPITPSKEKLAWETVKSILDDLIFWASGAESQQFMRSQEVVMGCFWNTRVKAIYDETDGMWDWTWNQGIVLPGAWVVPKNNPAGDAVWPFIASTQDPARQVKLFELFGNAPANPAAAPLVPPELKKFNATDPDNYALQLPVDNEWYGENIARVGKDYLDLISS
ncbi:extracellular solute-binding protein [Acuticoccus mangrovi]|uniref:Extracellular solute-binding protein n=1 Tax=Acuticoccus mangrovi TaxID=2796142 RepID=A0A934ID33_9HYPH|nr:extracellular solute-binding protein [Acuticoccus mangrovi]MBJ3774304.1 extracellular solute-binding protein [Acuticoccus mangrovi]